MSPASVPRRYQKPAPVPAGKKAAWILGGAALFFGVGLLFASAPSLFGKEHVGENAWNWPLFLMFLPIINPVAGGFLGYQAAREGFTGTIRNIALGLVGAEAALAILLTLIA